jgi:nucleoside-diphosphate-sugar epimerase
MAEAELVLVTVATGTVGGVVVQALLAAGVPVRGRRRSRGSGAGTVR